MSPEKDGIVITARGRVGLRQAAGEVIRERGDHGSIRTAGDRCIEHVFRRSRETVEQLSSQRV